MPTQWGDKAVIVLAALFTAVAFYLIIFAQPDWLAQHARPAVNANEVVIGVGKGSTITEPKKTP